MSVQYLDTVSGSTYGSIKMTRCRIIENAWVARLPFGDVARSANLSNVGSMAEIWYVSFRVQLGSTKLP